MSSSRQHPNESQKLDHMKTSANIFKNLWETGDFSDFVIIAGSKEFKVHKNILGSQSSVFKTIFNTTMKEQQTGKMKITDFSGDAVEGMLIFLYTGVVQETYAMDIYALASKYDLVQLKAICQCLVIRNINDTNALAILKLGNLYMDDKIKQFAFKRIITMFPSGEIIEEMMNFPDQIETMMIATQSRKRKIHKANVEYHGVMKRCKEVAAHK
jgi:BTB/POZ domain